MTAPARECQPGCATAPVAWQYRENMGSDWGDWLCLNIPIEKFKEDEKHAFEDGMYEIRPLYAVPTPQCEVLTEDAPAWARMRHALQCAKECLRHYAKIDYDADNNPQPNAAFDVEQICKEALYEVDLANAKAVAATLTEKLIQAAVDYESGRCSRRELSAARGAVELAIGASALPLEQSGSGK